MLENSLPMPPNCRRVANRKPSRSNALVALVRPSSSRHVSSWRLGCRAARRAPFAANRASTPRATRRSPPACWERSIGWPSASCVFKCCKVTAARHPAKPSSRARSMALSRSEPPRSLSISATRRSNALAALVRPFELAARKQLRLGCRASTSRALRCKPSLDATRTLALTACACWERSIGWPSASCVFKCCNVTAAPAPGTSSRPPPAVGGSHLQNPRNRYQGSFEGFEGFKRGSQAVIARSSG